MTSISYRSHHRILTAVLVALLICCTHVVEAKIRLVPRGRKNKNNNNNKNNRNRNKNKKLRRPQNNKQPQIVLKPRKKESPTLKLEATISKNENGEQVLLLSQDSMTAVSNAMQTGNTEVIAEAKQQAQIETQQEAQMIQMGEAVAADEPIELFYDPAELKTAPGEIPVPKRVFDADGNEVDLAGKEALLVPPHKDDGEHPPPPPPKDANGKKPHPKEHKDTTTTTESSTSESSAQDENISAPQTQDQMIIITTVATMALLVGALSARRLRSRQFLSFCIENESLEDELAYDAAYTTQSTVGASSFYAGAGYDTFGGSKFGGDLRWRGDLEKFDV